MIIPIIIEPSKIIHKISNTINLYNRDILFIKFILKRTMRFYKGIGLSCVQIGIPLEIISINSILIKKRVFINPKIIGVSYKKTLYKEGCLSLINVDYRVSRHIFLKLKFKNDLKKIEISNSIISICFQHEIDHIKGIIFTDRK